MSVARLSEALSYERDLNVKRKEILEFIRTAEEKASKPTAPITLDQAKRVLAEAGMVAVPVKPTVGMMRTLRKGWDSRNANTLLINYKAMVAAWEKPDA